MITSTPTGLRGGTPTCAAALLATLAAGLAGLPTAGCAKVSEKPGGPSGGGSGGSSGMMPSPQEAIPGLTELRVTPDMQTVTLTETNGTLSGSASFRAEGTVNGATMDVTDKVNWSSGAPTAIVNKGMVALTGPGTFTISARSGAITATGRLMATFKGDRMGTGFPEADKPKLDGTAGGTTNLAYPIDGSIFPSNFGPVTVHVAKSGSQNIARLSFLGDGLDLNYYARCETGTLNPTGGCYVSLPLAFTTLLIAPSTEHDITLTARLATSGGGGGGVVESNAVKVAWANLPLSGGLYYWTVIDPTSVPGYVLPRDATKGTAVMRYDFSRDNPEGNKPQVIYTDQGMPRMVAGRANPVFGNPGPMDGQYIDGVMNGDPGSPPAQKQDAPGDPLTGRTWGEGSCVGCHALSFDGKLLAFAIGGSDPANFAVLDLTTRKLLELDTTAGPANQNDVNYLRRFRKANFATFTTFGPSETDRRMVNSYHGKLTLHQVDTTLAVLADNLFAKATTEIKTDPFWSPDGNHFAFTSYPPPGNPKPTTEYNGDIKNGGQIWIATADAMGPHDDARLLVPREAGTNSGYPAISHDGELVVFNKSSCSGPMNPGGYGTGPCDGYDDITATLWLTTPGGRTPAKLAKANRGDSNGNSWPRWSPNRGTFRGQALYWMAFSSRAAYGLQVNTGAVAMSVPQLWFAAVLTGGEFASGDSSYSPIWLPNQNLIATVPTGNHVPQWVKVAVAID